jgi:inhibitor of KinA
MVLKLHNLSNFSLTYKRFNEKAILIAWPPEIKQDILLDVLNFKQKIENDLINSIQEVRSAYQSLLVTYATDIFDLLETINNLKEIYSSANNLNAMQSRLWKIPVCYDTYFGLDLEHMSNSKNISHNDIIKLHVDPTYTIYFIGFLPGFLYLGGLDERLFIPRKETPRMQIKKGSVAIGGNQTGVYPNTSPGGWNIIGNSPVIFFNPKSETPCFAKAGDRIQFFQVSLKEYASIKALVEKGVYNLESEAWYD